MNMTVLKVRLIAVVVLSALCVSSAAAADMDGRTAARINDDWSFRFASQVSGRGIRVDLPHTWNAGDALSGNAAYQRTTGVYEKRLKYDPSWNGRRVILRFEGANQNAAVWVNSRLAGTHKGGYTAFAMDITDLLREDADNLLTVRVSNALDQDVMPLVGDFNMYGGLYRDVWLYTVDPLHVSLADYGSKGVYLTQKSVSRERGDVEAAVVVSNSGREAASGKVKVTVADGSRIVASGEGRFDCQADSSIRVTVDLSIKNPHLWDGRKGPFMYEATAVVTDADGNVTDRVSEALGLRWFGVDADNGFMLNGRSYPLRGVCRHQDRAERGNALLPEHHREDAEIISEIGATGVRLAHYPQAEEFYGLMDRYGIVVWAEIPFVGPGGYLDRGYTASPEFHANGRQQLVEMIRQHYNHPSICFWGLFNELKTHGDNPTAYVGELNELAHAEDPTRLTTGASNIDASDPLSFTTDLIAWNKYYGWYGGSARDLGRWLDDTHKRHGDLRIAISEYGAGASIYHQQDSVKPGISSGMWHPENYQTEFHRQNWQAIAERPYVWGSFIWNMFDFGAAHRTEGDRYGINDKGLVSFDRKVKKDAFYFYRANWNDEIPTLYIAERRHDIRSSELTDVTVFASHPEVELRLNGRSLGKMTPQGLSTFVMKGVRLVPGVNVVEACAKDGSVDRVEWRLERQ